VAVIEHGGFRRAAEAVHISQPALTKSIQRLEQVFGVELVDRSSRPARPTPFGEIVLEGARRILADLAQTRREVDLLKGFSSGVLVVGCDPYAGPGVLAPALASLVDAHPKLRYEVVVAGWRELKGRLLDRSIDLHVGASPEVHGRDVETLAFEMEPLTVFCRAGHPLTALEKVTPEDLLPYPRLGIEAPPEWIRTYTGLFGIRPVKRDVFHRRFASSTSWDVVIAVVRSSDSISAGPRSVIEAELAAGRLVSIDAGIPPFRPPGTIAWEKGRILPPAAKALIDAILDHLGQPGETD